MNSKASQGKKSYNEIIEKPFIINLQNVRTVHRHCRSSQSRPDVIGCGREVAERVKKTTSVLKMKKKKELPMKLLDDPKIPTARRNPRRPHYSHKSLDVAIEMGLKPGRPYCTRRRHHHLSATTKTLTLKMKNEALKTGNGALPSTRAEIHRASMARRPQRRAICGGASGRRDEI
jgi:hypothetical protein